MEQEKEKLLEDLEIERQRHVRAQQQHLVDLKKLEERLRDEILKLTTACEKEKTETLELIENVNVSALKISELQWVILSQEKEKTEYVNLQKVMSEQAEVQQKHAEEKVNELEATVEKLKNDLSSMNNSAKEAQSEIETMVEKRDKTGAEMEILHQKLDNAVELSVNHEELLQKTAASLDDLGLKVENLVMQLAKKKTKAGKTKALVQQLRQKVEFLETSLRVQKENGSICLSQLLDMKENVSEKDKKLGEYIKKKAKLEVQMKNLSEKMDLMKKKNEEESSGWQAANCELKSQVYLLTAASESIWSEMDEKLETAENIREVLSAQVESRDQFITAQKKFAENWMISMAVKESTLRDRLCKKHDIIVSTLGVHMKKFIMLCNGLVKLKQKFVENKSEFVRLRKANVGLETAMKNLRATVESLNNELTEKNNVILDRGQELMEIMKFRDNLLAKKLSVEEKLEDTIGQVSEYSNQLEEMRAELKNTHETLRTEVQKRSQLEFENTALINKLEEINKEVLNLENNNAAMLGEFRELALIAESVKSQVTERASSGVKSQRHHQQDGEAGGHVVAEERKSLKDDLLLLVSHVATYECQLKNLEIQKEKCIGGLQLTIKDITSKNVKLNAEVQTSLSLIESWKSKADGLGEELSVSLSKITTLEDIINEQTQRMTTQKISLEDLQNHQADMEQLNKSLKLKNQTQKETHAIAVEKLEKQ